MRIYEEREIERERDRGRQREREKEKERERKRGILTMLSKPRFFLFSVGP